MKLKLKMFMKITGAMKILVIVQLNQNTMIIRTN